MNNVGLLTIFMLSMFVGFEVISKVSAVLHTPLMSGANAIHGVILVGAILITGTASGGVQVTLGLGLHYTPAGVQHIIAPWLLPKLAGVAAGTYKP